MDTTGTAPSGGDFFTRISQLVSTVEPIWLVGMFVAMLVIAALAVIGGRRGLFLLLLLALTLSASIWSQLDLAAALVRWTTLVALAITAVKIRNFPGWPWLLMAGYTGLGIVWLVVAEHFGHSFQVTAVLIMITLAAAAVADNVKDIDTLSKIFNLAIIAAAVWAGVALFSLSDILNYQQYRERFSGATGSAPVFVTTGGFFLPIVVWGALRRASSVGRIACGILAAVMIVFLVMSGQRAGALAGIIGCVPLFLNRSVRKTLVVGTLVALSVGLTYIMFLQSPDQFRYVLRRYGESGLNAREVIWSLAVGLCVENPLFGAGHGAAMNMVSFPGSESAIRHAGPHNAFLAVWYNTGFFGLLMVVSAVGLATWQAFLMASTAKSENARQAASLLLGLLLMLVAVSMVTDGFSNPSTITTVGIFTVIALIGRLPSIDVVREPSVRFWVFAPVNQRTAT